MNYIEIYCSNILSKQLCEILIARLVEIGFESFAEAENGVYAYISEKEFSEKNISDEIEKIACDPKIMFTKKIIIDKNWNALWESNYEPVIIAGKCSIRAPFHSQDKNIKYDIVIEPKMSFGTAHHETTAMMIELLLNEDLKGENVLDMGCGTGVLAILCSKLGAEEITAIDNNEWAYKNSLENIKKNNITNIHVFFGDSSLLQNKSFDKIVANINRNVLLQDLPVYSKSLKNKGILLISGFYEKDLPVLKATAEENNLRFIKYTTKNNWAAACFIR